MLGPAFPAARLPHLDEVELPKVQRIRVKQPEAEAIGYVEGAIRAEIVKSRPLRNLPRSASVAVGGRGIAEVAALTRTVVACLQEMGLENGEADRIVTGDRDLLAFRPVRGTPSLTPAARIAVERHTGEQEKGRGRADREVRQLAGAQDLSIG